MFQRGGGYLKGGAEDTFSASKRLCGWTRGWACLRGGGGSLAGGLGGAGGGPGGGGYGPWPQR